MKDIVIYGSGSVGRMAKQIIDDVNLKNNSYNVLGYLDDDSAKWGKIINNKEVLGGKDWLVKNKCRNIVLGFSSPKQKKNLIESLGNEFNVSFVTLVHPLAWISDRVKLGVGVVIYPGVYLDIDIKVGDFVLINKSSTIGHDTILGNYVTISPGVNIGGYNLIMEGVEIGINACSIQYKKIGEWSNVGAGSSVIKDIPSFVVAVGAPAGVIKSLKE